MNAESPLSSAIASSTPIRRELLQLNLCRECGYCIGGLRDHCNCPECGRSFDQSTLFLFGYARATRSTIETAKPWVAVLWAFMMSANIFRAMFDRSASMPSTLISAGLILLIIAFLFWRRGTNPKPGTIVVELSPDEGCRQNEMLCNERFTAWSVIEHVLIKMTGDETCRIQLAKQVGRLVLQPRAVDAEVQCSAEKAELLREQVQTWIKEAKARLHLNDGGVH